jgi:GT2 family glycosyltransferase
MIVCQKDTAVVVLSYNGKNLHKDFFPELVAESKNLYDVVLVDNASTDGTLAYVKENFPTVLTVSIRVNNGFSHGYYDGLKQIQAKYYVLLSADFEITPGWFLPMYNLMQTDNNIAACQPKIKYYKDKKMFEYAGAGGAFMDKWGYMFCRGRIFFTLEEDKKQYDNNIQVFWAGGGCLMVQADLYHQVGGLDKDLYAHMEEIDLCWRLQNRGHKIAYCGQSTVYHIGGSVISYGSPQKLYYNHRNNLILLTKNLPKHLVFKTIFIRLVLDGITGARALMQGKLVDTYTILKAHLHFYRKFAFWYRKRSLDNPKGFMDITKSPVVLQSSIVAKYFLKKRKLFTDLDFKETPLAK